MTRGKHTQRRLDTELYEDSEIMRKVQSNGYAHKLYAALCNTEWQPDDVIDILKENTWSCSWRGAGGIIADLRNEGDYINWYCSGFEGYVHSEVEQDLKKLGWICVDKDEYIGEHIAEEEWGSFTGIAGALSRNKNE